MKTNATNETRLHAVDGAEWVLKEKRTEGSDETRALGPSKHREAEQRLGMACSEIRKRQRGLEEEMQKQE